MCHRIHPNLSPRGETFKDFNGLEAIFRSKKLKKVKSIQSQGEGFGERFKSYKYMKNNIYIKKIIIFHLFTPPPHTRRVMRARA
jgi:hypothetical protein